jgi:amidase
MCRILSAILLLVLAACTGSERDYSEADIAELHDHMQRGEISSEELVRWYIERVETIDRAGPALNSIIEINPDALKIAKALDNEWKTSGPRGPLHGIPVILKANIDTADQMYTSAGSLALAEHVPPSDAFVVKRLRDAGAVILISVSGQICARRAHKAAGAASVVKH